MASETYAIGTRFIPAGRKVAQEFTVTDILKTFNSAGELVKVRYVASHQFMGQTVTDHDVCAATIARGLIASASELKAIDRALAMMNAD